MSLKTYVLAVSWKIFTFNQNKKKFYYVKLHGILKGICFVIKIHLAKYSMGKKLEIFENKEKWLYNIVFIALYICIQ